MATTTTTTTTTIATTGTKLSKAPAHTAGIYADMTVDGDEIGTLVAFVGRARHLPNRKTVGKQDPYCAARLGKEARKTSTDKRGGQTPRWDQELSFTVYDSADYHKLKISLFNDDKKCELIGEAWIVLTDLLQPGGGQSDKWHPLNWKGRHAGEVQLRLNYRDSRPPPPGEQMEARTAQRSESAPEALPTGPRGLPKRPLPAQPSTLAAQKAQIEQSQAPAVKSRSFGPRQLNPEPLQAPPQPQPQPQPQPLPEVSHEAKSDYGYGYEQRPPADHQLAYDQSQQEPASSELYYPREQQPEPLRFHQQKSNRQPAPRPRYYDERDTFEDEFPPSLDDELELPELPPLVPRPQRQTVPQQPRHYAAADRHTTQEYALPHYNQPAPARSMEPLRPSSRQSTAPSHYSGRGPRRSFGEQPATDAMLNSPPPPLPPTHRNRGYTDVPQPLALSYGEASGHDQAPSRPQLTAEALHDPSIDDELFMPMPGAETQLSTRSAPLPEGYHDPRPPRRNSGFAPLGDPRYPQDQPYPSNNEFSRAPYGHFDDGHRMPAQDAYQTPPRRAVPGLRHHASASFDSPRGFPSEPAVYRSTVPVVKPQPLVPEMLTPRHSIPRKSISPGGSPGDTESLAGSAFSPDSFDVLNPNLHAARTINDPIPKFDTPESIREAFRDRFKEEELASSGPIMDAAGNVIDPSDHLPRDAWAPEPEKKTPRKTHEIKLKFRHHAHSSPAQAMPRVTPREQHSAQSARFSSPYSHTSYSPSVHGGTPRREPGLRPQSMQPMPHHSSPALPPQSMHAYQEEEMSPSHQSGGRNRLQKRAPAHVQNAASSPGMHQQAMRASYVDSPPSRHYREEYHQTASSPMDRRYESYGTPSPLREMRNPNGGYGNAYGYGQRSSPMAPPVPAKVPLGREQEDWEADRLSMEIGSIDLGPRGVRRR